MPAHPSSSLHRHDARLGPHGESWSMEIGQPVMTHATISISASRTPRCVAAAAGSHADPAARMPK